MNSRSFDDFEIGERFVSPGITVSEGQIMDFSPYQASGHVSHPFQILLAHGSAFDQIALALPTINPLIACITPTTSIGWLGSRQLISLIEPSKSRILVEAANVLEVWSCGQPEQKA